MAPAQRAKDDKPIDQKWTAAIDRPQSGCRQIATWAYQITPFDEWDYDGINEMILADLDIGGRRPRLSCISTATASPTHSIAKRVSCCCGEVRSTVNWASHVEMDKANPNYGRPKVVEKYSTFLSSPDVNTRGICPTALGTKEPAPASYSPKAKLFFVPANQVCMDYEPFQRSNTRQASHTSGATVAMSIRRPEPTAACRRSRPGTR